MSLFGRAFRLVTRIINFLGAKLPQSQAKLKYNEKYFDTDWYSTTYPDIADFDGTPFQHFIRHGIKEGRQGRFFAPVWYRESHSDIRASITDPWQHYLEHGRNEGRAAIFHYVQSAVEVPNTNNYQEWLRFYDNEFDVTIEAAAEIITHFELNTKFEIIITLSPDIANERLVQALGAIEKQIYAPQKCVFVAPKTINWKAAEIQKVISKITFPIEIIEYSNGENPLETVNAHLQKSETEYFVFSDDKALIHRFATLWFALFIKKSDKEALIYGDDDILRHNGLRAEPNFKSKFNLEIAQTLNFVGHIACVKREQIQEISGFCAEFDNMFDALHDLSLTFFAKHGALSIGHMQRVLSHILTDHRKWHSNPLVQQRHINNNGLHAQIVPIPEVPSLTRIKYSLIGRKPLVSIIIPTRDKLDILKKCVDSILELTNYENFEIIIVDNNSIEAETLEYLEFVASHKKISVLRLECAFNFSYLNNQAVKKAKGSQIVLMNNDIEVITPTWIEEMLAYSQHENTGCVGARLYYENEQIQHSGVLCGFHGVAGHRLRNVPRGDPGPNCLIVVPQEISAVTAAVMMIKKSVLEKAGGLDEGLAVAFNDVDLCLKVKMLGYRNIYVPSAEFFHYESVTRGADDTPEKKIREQREIGIMKNRWGHQLGHDDLYSPNLTLVAEDLSLAFPPRQPTIQAIADKKILPFTEEEIA